MVELRAIDYQEISGREKSRLKVVESSLRSGLTRTAESFIKRFGPALAASASPAAASIWEDLLQHLSALKKAEEQYGLGAMLDTSRTVVQKLLDAKKFDGQPAITQEMLAARERRLARAA